MCTELLVASYLLKSKKNMLCVSTITLGTKPTANDIFVAARSLFKATWISVAVIYSQTTNQHFRSKLKVTMYKLEAAARLFT